MQDWYYMFMDHHPNLLLKAPEGMSIVRVIAFNKVHVETFLKAYTLTMEKYEFTPDRIFSLDESSLSTVMKPVKDTIMLVGILNVVGQSIPPVFVIPRCR